MLPAMPKYSFFVRSRRNRIRYPKTFQLTDVEAARQGAERIARAFSRVVPRWSELTSNQRKNFMVEVVDETDQPILTVPFEDAEEPKP